MDAPPVRGTIFISSVLHVWDRHPFYSKMVLAPRSLSRDQKILHELVHPPFLERNVSSRAWLVHEGRVLMMHARLTVSAVPPFS